MAKKIYNSFMDKNGNEYRFDSYPEFAEWYFHCSYKFIQHNFDEATRKKLQRAASESKEAKQSKYIPQAY